MNAQSARRMVLYLGLIILVTSVLLGFYLVGSPQLNRKLTADRLRMQDLMRIQRVIEHYTRNEGKLPETLQALYETPAGQASWYGPFHLEDPITKARYKYRVKGSYKYELCATFALSSAEEEKSWRRDGTFPTIPWKHESGEQCFSFGFTPAQHTK